MKIPYDLLEAYFLGNMTPKEFVQLTVWLKADDKHIKILIDESILHDGIFHNLSGQEFLRLEKHGIAPYLNNEPEQPQGTSLVGPNIEEIQQRAEQQLQRFRVKQERQRRELAALSRRQPTFTMNWQAIMQGLTRSWIWLKRLSVSGALLLTLVLICVGGYQSIRSRQVVATLGPVLDAKWTTLPQANGQLRRCSLELVKGFAEIHFANGAHVMVEAPCRFHLSEPDAMFLEEGAVTARVTPPAENFIVDTDTARIEDLGTEFGVSTHVDGQTRAVVFDGVVRLAEAEAREHPTPDQCVDIKAGYQSTVTAEGRISGLVERLPRHHIWIQTWDDALYNPRISGQALFLRSPPASVCLGDMADADKILLFLEQKNVVLQRDWVGVTTETGTYKYPQDQEPKGRITAGWPLDSYLLSFDLKGLGQVGEVVDRSAEIRFPRPIVGVIVDHEMLADSDTVFGHAAVRYPADPKGRGLDLRGETTSNDSLTISSDRRTLRIRLSTEEYYDQARVLIESVNSDSLVKPPG